MQPIRCPFAISGGGKERLCNFTICEVAPRNPECAKMRDIIAEEIFVSLPTGFEGKNLTYEKLEKVLAPQQMDSFDTRTAQFAETYKIDPELFREGIFDKIRNLAGTDPSPFETFANSIE